MGEQVTTILKDSSVSAVRSCGFWPRRVKGCFVVAGAVLVSGLGSGSTSGAAAPAAGPATRADQQARVVQSQLWEPTRSSGCRGELWSMSRLHGSAVWVGDHATGRIRGYRLDGTRLRVIDTRLGRERLTGFRVESDGSLSVLDVRENRAVRLRASQT